MAVLVLGEVVNGALALDATAKTVTAAKSLGDVTVLVMGSGAKSAGATAATLDGVSKVLHADDASLDHALAENAAALIVGLQAATATSVPPATTDAKHLPARGRTSGCHGFVRSDGGG